MEPRTLQEAIVYFSDPVNCREYVVARRWRNGVICPRCGTANVVFQEKYNRGQCNKRHDRRQFTIKTGTICEASPLGLDKWLTAMWMIANCKNGISSWEIHRAIGVTQKTAWFMLHRIRLAMQDGSFSKFGGGGPVEADETMIRGLGRFMDKDKKEEKITGTGRACKELVMGLLDGETGKVRVKHITNRKRRTLQRRSARQRRGGHRSI